MRLYALRDRLIDYFMRPFTAETDAQVLASVASTVNNQEGTDAIHTNPHQFEIWRLAEIDEKTGHIKPAHEYLADAASLVRGGIRDRGPGRPGTAPLHAAADSGGKPPAGAPPSTNADQRAPTDPTQAENRQGAENDQGPSRTA